jgi:UDP-glucose 4-epimerase
MRRNGVIPAFVDRALAGQPIEIQGNGFQFRQFTHVADIANAFALAIEAKSLAAVYNIAVPERISIRELAEMVARRIPADLVRVTSRANDAPFAIISSRRAEAELGWRPQVLLSRGLEQLIDLYTKDARATAA